MEITSLQLIGIFIVSAIAGMGSVLDEFQTHRPLIACTLTGLVLGDMTTGIIIGGTLEMIALGWMNIGAAMAPDAALASTISTILVIAGGQSIGAGIALAMPIAAAGAPVRGVAANGATEPAVAAKFAAAATVSANRWRYARHRVRPSDAARRDTRYGLVCDWPYQPVRAKAHRATAFGGCLASFPDNGDSDAAAH